MDQNNYIIDVNFDENDIIVGDEQPMNGQVQFELEYGEQAGREGNVFLDMIYFESNGEQWIHNGNLPEQIDRPVADVLADMSLEDHSDSDDYVFFGPRPDANELFVIDDNEDADDDESYMYFDGQL